MATLQEIDSMMRTRASETPWVIARMCFPDGFTIEYTANTPLFDKPLDMLPMKESENDEPLREEVSRRPKTVPTRLPNSKHDPAFNSLTYAEKRRKVISARSRSDFSIEMLVFVAKMELETKKSAYNLLMLNKYLNSNANERECVMGRIGTQLKHLVKANAVA